MLDRDDPPGRETAAVAVARHLIDDRHARIAGAHEITVQRMGNTRALDRADGRDQRLADDLAPEHALPADLRARAAEQIALERLEIERPDQFGNPRCHHLAPADASG